MFKSVLFFAVTILAFHSRNIAGKSLGKPNLKDHSIKKRSSYFLWQDTCPPPVFLAAPEEKCKDTCHSNDDCLGNLLCCDNGCKMCMEPVLPPPVIDWLGSPSTYHRGFAAGGVPESNHIDVDLTEPHFEEVACAHEGKSYARGEAFYKGCHKCQCRVGGISCEVGPCKTDPNKEEHSGEASGVDVSRVNPVEALELSGDDENQLQEYPSNPKRFESLELHREEGEGQAEVRVIPRFHDLKRTSGNGEESEERVVPKFHDHKRTSGNGEESGNNFMGELGQSGEVDNHIVLPQLTETAEHSGHEFVEKIKVRRLPRLRKIVRRKQPKKDVELYKNVLII